jgi:choline dehydrogenase-like flavoprotein
MIVDARELDRGTVIEGDVCVVGAGAAGITIARELLGSPLRVIVLESGGLEFDERIQSLYAGRNIGFPAYDIDTNRLRYFGGTTNHWVGTLPTPGSDRFRAARLAAALRLADLARRPRSARPGPGLG